MRRFLDQKRARAGNFAYALLGFDQVDELIRGPRVQHIIFVEPGARTDGTFLTDHLRQGFAKRRQSARQLRRERLAITSPTREVRLTARSAGLDDVSRVAAKLQGTA